MIACMCLSFTACHNSTQPVDSDSDTTWVDSIATDTVAVDTVVCDTVCAK